MSDMKEEIGDTGDGIGGREEGIEYKEEINGRYKGRNRRVISNNMNS